MLALPGGAYVYQGEELGLPEVEDLPEDGAAGPDLGAVRPHRPRPRRLPGADAVVGRRRAPYGFSPEGARRALAAAAGRVGRAHVEAQTGDPDSMLELYRDRAAAAPEAPRARRRRPELARRRPRRPGLRPRARLRLRGEPVGRPVPAARPSAEVLLASGPLAADGHGGA